MRKLPRILSVGFNNKNWTANLQCLGSEDLRGCGAIIEVPRGALFTLGVPSMGMSRDEVCFCCPDCLAETPIEHGSFFEGLPTRKEWFAENRPKEGFVIELACVGYFSEETDDPHGWTHVTDLQEATVYPTIDAAQAVIDGARNLATDGATIIRKPDR